MDEHLAGLERNMRKDGVLADIPHSKHVARTCIRAGRAERALDILGIILDGEPDDEEARALYVKHGGITQDESGWIFRSIRLGRQFYDIRFDRVGGKVTSSEFSVGQLCAAPLPLLFNAMYRTYVLLTEQLAALDAFRSFLCDTEWSTTTRVQFEGREDVCVRHGLAHHLDRRIILDMDYHDNEQPWRHNYNRRRAIHDRQWLLAKQQAFDQLGAAEPQSPALTRMLDALLCGPSDEAGPTIQYALGRAEEYHEDRMLPTVWLDLACTGCEEGMHIEGDSDHFISLRPGGLLYRNPHMYTPLAVLPLRENFHNSGP